MTMRLTVVANLCALILVMTDDSLAEAQEDSAPASIASFADGPMRMRSNQQRRLLGQLFMAPLYFMGYIVVHEGSHALAAQSFGWGIERFEPYPHTVIRPDGERDFLFGCVRYRNTPDDVSRSQLALVSVAPYITDTVLFTTADLLLSYAVDPHSAVAPFLFVGGMVTPLVNFVTGLNCMDEHCDISRFSEWSGIPRGAVMMIGYSMAFVALWRCIRQFRRIFMEPRTEPHAARERNRYRVSAAPLLGGVGGVGLSGTF